jgi:hypothetical protein
MYILAIKIQIGHDIRDRLKNDETRFLYIDLYKFFVIM